MSNNKIIAIYMDKFSLASTTNRIIMIAKIQPNTKNESLLKCV